MFTCDHLWGVRDYHFCTLKWYICAHIYGYICAYFYIWSSLRCRVPSLLHFSVICICIYVYICTFVYMWSVLTCPVLCRSHFRYIYIVWIYVYVHMFTCDLFWGVWGFLIALVGDVYYLHIHAYMNICMYIHICVHAIFSEVSEAITVAFVGDLYMHICIVYVHMFACILLWSVRGYHCRTLTKEPPPPPLRTFFVGWFPNEEPRGRGTPIPYLKSATSYQKSPTSYQKGPICLQKSPISYPKCLISESLKEEVLFLRAFHLQTTPNGNPSGGWGFFRSTYRWLVYAYMYLECSDDVETYDIWDTSLLQFIVSFIGLFCKRDLSF